MVMIIRGNEDKNEKNLIISLVVILGLILTGCRNNQAKQDSNKNYATSTSSQSNSPYLNLSKSKAEQLDEVRPAIPAINEAVATLIDNLTNEEWMVQHVKVLHEADPNDRTTGLNSYIHTIEDGEYETKVYLTYMPNILSATLIYPNRPGAIINNFNEMAYS